MKIGFIGLGLMGSRMAEHLLQEEHELFVYNRTSAKAQPLLDKGAKWSPSPRHLAAEVELLFTMLTAPAVVSEAAAGEHGFLMGLRSGALWVDCTTVNPSFSIEMNSLAKERNVHFLDAPVIGSIVPAQQGQLLFVVGGDQESFNRCEPYFNLMGRHAIHVGETGKGSAFKMLSNLMLGVTMTAFRDALRLGTALGIPDEVLFDTFLPLPVNPPYLASKKGKIQSGSFEAEFPLKWMEKDLRLVMQTAEELGITLEIARASKELYTQAVESGFGEEDFSAVTKRS
jgi:3-hydroxyisobutyrate dehydrogenase-like beta-hydroxyacid dehydrogenase